jgi:methylase of polypeptide subunit release factors
VVHTSFDDVLARVRRGTGSNVQTLHTTRFGDLDIVYDERVLAPRPWTLLQSRWAIELHKKVPPGPILELCAGTGHIGLVAAYETGRFLVQIEDSAVAAQCAMLNAREAGVRDFRLRIVDLTRSVSWTERFPLIVADPPYVPSDETSSFPDDPPAAIDGGPDGLRVIRQCLHIADRTLVDGGAMLLQVRGEAQARQVADEVSGAALRLKLDEVRAHDDNRAVALLTRD